MEYDTKGQILKKPVVWKGLYFYRHSHNDYGDYAPLVALFSFALMHKKERFCT